MSDVPRVAVVWRGDPTEEAGEGRFGPTLAALRARGLAAEPVAFAEDAADVVRARLLKMDGVLVWVDPIMGGVTRARLDAVLRDVAAAGVWVSTHPDVILTMGTKQVLVDTQAMAWGTPCVVHRTLDELRERLPERLELGPRVLKQHRGQSGDGVWKVEWAGEGRGLAAPVRVQHAARGSLVEEVALGAFVERCGAYFAGTGCLIEQPYQARLADGMIRCYLVGDRVAGFGHQHVTALLPPPAGMNEVPAPPPRLYYGPEKPEFQELKRRLEGGWVREMAETLGLSLDQLPALWDADFLLGPKDADGRDSYVLCEINVSSVYPYPEAAQATLAEHVARRLGVGVRR